MARNFWRPIRLPPNADRTNEPNTKLPRQRCRGSDADVAASEVPAKVISFRAMLILKPRSQATLCSLVMCLLMFLGMQTFAEGVPDDCTQLMLATAPTWNSARGELRLFERPRGGDWKVVAGPFPVLFGKKGLAWGTGLAGQNEPGLRKKERDGRAPAGIFEIGQVFGDDEDLPAGADYPYHQVTDADLWSDDPRSPNYNRHIVIDPKNPPDNYTHERMRRAILPITG